MPPRYLPGAHRALKQQALLLLKLINAALNGVFDDKAPHFHGAVLAETVDAIHRLGNSNSRRVSEDKEKQTRYMMRTEG